MPITLVRNRSGTDQLDTLNARFDVASPAEIIEFAADRFGDRLCLAASFTDCVLIEIATSVVPDIEVVFANTLFHFPETLETMRRAQIRYGLNLTVLDPSPDASDVWSAGAESCCNDRKTSVLDAYLREGSRAWISGIRRSDGPSRANANLFETDRRGLVKINPIVGWTDLDIAMHVSAHNTITNPLLDQGYTSIGCWPCTEPTLGADSRAGRWSGSEKTECGLHT